MEEFIVVTVGKVWCRLVLNSHMFRQEKGGYRKEGQNNTGLRRKSLTSVELDVKNAKPKVSA